MCLWPSRPLSAGLAPCDPAGINPCLTCFLQSIHKDLEAKIARFHQREDAILYPSCFDANAGLFEVCEGHGRELVKPARLWKDWAIREPGRMPVPWLEAPVIISFGGEVKPGRCSRNHPEACREAIFQGLRGNLHQLDG